VNSQYLLLTTLLLQTIEVHPAPIMHDTEAVLVSCKYWFYRASVRSRNSLCNFSLDISFLPVCLGQTLI
jgi:hypothetical protein